MINFRTQVSRGGTKQTWIVVDGLNILSDLRGPTWNQVVGKRSAISVPRSTIESPTNRASIVKKLVAYTNKLLFYTDMSNEWSPSSWKSKPVAQVRNRTI